jgi:RimJ/RimL family protein N-acetyltransferase
VIDARSYTASEALRDGTLVTVRAIRRDDGSGILAAFDRLDRESVYTRFFTYKKQLSDADLRGLTDVDFDHVVALVATTKKGDAETLIGGGRYCSEVALRDAQGAELAFITAIDYRGRGVAGVILKHLIRIGRDQGLLRFEADVLAQNQAMLAVFRGSGLSMKKRREDSVVHVVLSF